MPASRRNGTPRHATPPDLWFPHPLMWAAIGAQWLIIAALSWRLGFAIHPMRDWPTQAAVLSAMLAAGFSLRRRWPNITRALFGLVAFYISGLGIVALSYLATFASASTPLADPFFAAFDRAAGFDWKAHVAWVNARPAVMETLIWGYGQIAYSFIFAMATLMAARKFRRLAEFFIVLFASSLVMIALAWLFPAIGPYTHLTPDQADISRMPSGAGRYWLPHFTALRAHLMTSVTLGETTGLIAFPSFHATAALITSWAVWRRPMFWPLLVMNAAMLISTLSIGGHYLADVLASAVILAACVALARRLPDGLSPAPAPHPATRPTRPPLAGEQAA